MITNSHHLRHPSAAPARFSPSTKPYKINTLIASDGLVHTIRPAIRPLHCGHYGDQGNYLAAPRSYISSSDPSRAHLCELVALEKRQDGQGSHGELERECPGSVLLGRASWCPVRLADVRISGSAVTRRFQIDGIRLQLKLGRRPQGGRLIS
jgi:hypothetical protein